MVVTALMVTTKIHLEFVNNLFSSLLPAMLANTLIQLRDVLLVLDLVRLAHQLLCALPALLLDIVLILVVYVFLNVVMDSLLEIKLVILVLVTHLDVYHVKF